MIHRLFPWAHLPWQTVYWKVSHLLSVLIAYNQEFHPIFTLLMLKPSQTIFNPCSIGEIPLKGSFPSMLQGSSRPWVPPPAPFACKEWTPASPVSRFGQHPPFWPNKKVTAEERTPETSTCHDDLELWQGDSMWQGCCFVPIYLNIFDIAQPK